jgi:2-desacetyl-2-hydroxyethyl bacteriochlorophyllide A dehydrogenase
MAIVKAVQLVTHGKPGQFRLQDLPDPAPGPDEVVVQVKACGLNHLDLWLEEGALPVPVQLPRIPGCEVAGVVTALGDDVDEWRRGDRVAVQSNLFCGHCEHCEHEEESLCLHTVILGVQRDGGFAEKLAVPATGLVRLPDNVDFQTSAALTLAGSTAMHMLADRATVNAGEWVLVMGGASGVGSAAIQIARQYGGRVISTGSTKAKRDLALELGAEFVVDSTDPDWPREVRQITERRGVSLVVEHVGGPVLNQVLHCLARGGTVVTCGATAGSKVELDLWGFFVRQHRLIGSYGRNRTDLRLTLEWAADGRLRPVVQEVYPLAKAAEALARLRRREVLGKLLVVP